MADEQQIGVEEAAAPVVESGVPEETPANQEGGTPSIPKPRFDEVLHRAKAAEQHARDLETRVQSLERQPAHTQPAQQLPTLAQVFDFYERGQITEAQKDQWVVYHTKEAAKQEFGQAIRQTTMLAKAQTTTAEYLKAYPALTDGSSHDFQALSATYNELLSEGHPNSVATQAAALRMTFGPIKAASQITPTEHTRQRADTFLEGAGGGGRMAESDVLKQVDERQIKFWKQKGYTKTQMTDEARYKGVGNISDYRRTKKKA